MDYQQLKKRYFLELQEQLAKSEKRHVEEVEGLSAQLSHQIQYNNTLFDQLQQLGQQQQVASKFAQEAKALIVKVTTQRDNALSNCDQLQHDLADKENILTELEKDRNVLVAENDQLKADNKLFRDELLQLKDTIAEYKQQIEQLKELDENPDGADHANGIDGIQADLDAVRREMDQLNMLVGAEKERARILEGALAVERAEHRITAASLRASQDETKNKLEEIDRLLKLCTDKDMEIKSTSLDVEFLRTELKSAHKHAASYAMERDERATVCDALAAETRTMKERIIGLEHNLEATNKEKEAGRQQADNAIQNLQDEHLQLLDSIQAMEQQHQNELLTKASEMEQLKRSYEESMQEHYSALSQQYVALQNGLQEELRRLLQEKNVVVQTAREERLHLEGALSSLSAKYNALETSSREREARDRDDIEKWRRELERVSRNYDSFQASSENILESLTEELKECRAGCVEMMSHYGEVTRNVSPLSASIRALAEEQHAQAETSFDQLHQLHQQYTSLYHDMGKLEDERTDAKAYLKDTRRAGFDHFKKQALEIVHEETRSHTLMLEETQSKLQRNIKDLENKLEAMADRARVAENKNQEIGILKSTIQSLHEEIQHRAMRESSLQAKLDVAGSQLAIMTEENVKAAQQAVDLESDFSRRMAEADEQLEALNMRIKAILEEREVLMRDLEAIRADAESLRSQQAALMSKIETDRHQLEDRQRELEDKEKSISALNSQNSTQKQTMAAIKQQLTQVQTAVITLQEQRKKLQADNMELKEELDYLYKHQQMVTSLQQNRTVGGPEPVSDKSIMDALAKQNKIIEEKCRMLQDNATKLMRDFTLPSSLSLPISPDTHF